jgi:type I restriction-modification system DNA methylase subunit
MSGLGHLIERYELKKDDDEFARNEAQVRASLVGPFFHEALGWDTENPDEFKYEKPIAGKRADIIACIDGISQFIVEVKSLNHDIFDKPDYYKQAIQYADGLEKDYAILTNFRQFVILRTDFRPKADNWLSLEVDRFSINQLAKDLGLLALFHHDIWQDQKEKLTALDRKFGESYKRRKPVNDRLLELFVDWRSSCLGWLRKNKPRLLERSSTEALEEEVQRYIDRLVFITSCEDREIEDSRIRQFVPRYKSTLRIEGHVVTRGITEVFDHYYNRYNSDLFERGTADSFEFDDSVTFRILSDIKFPQNELPYDFSQIPIDVLGKAYENFIGHLIRGRVNVEEVVDAQKRKQEGVFYTPQWVVEQIVSKTVRRAVKGKTYEELFDTKILDPACGSGTFLIAAYTELVRYAESVHGSPLGYDDRKRLFLSCVFGVDKDDRACDIAKLNVSLVLAEKNRRLPSLSHNIQCGDSLITSELIDYSKGKRWKDRFPEVFKREHPGFDVIIGNPPYLSAKDFDESTKFETVLREEFGEVKDLYWLFIQLNHRLIRDNGIWGFIVPNTFFTLTHYRDVRELLRNDYESQIVDLSPNVFKDAYVFNAILIAKKNPRPANHLEIAYLPKESAGRVNFARLSYDEISQYPKMPFFTPNEVYERFDKRLLKRAGELSVQFEREILNAKSYQKNRERINDHLGSLKPGEITLLGLACEGSQGLVTGNNSRYIGLMPEDGEQQLHIWQEFNLKLAMVSRGFEFLDQSERNTHSLYEKAEELKAKKKDPILFGKKFLYKTISPQQVRDYTSLSPNEMCNGIADSKKCWVLYFRGNDQGDVWRVQNPEYICWSREYVKELREGVVTNSRWQGDRYFFKSGFGWVDYFDERIKGFYVEPTVYSKNVVKFHSEYFPDEYALGLLNSSYASYYVKRYITNTRTLQVNDGKLVPLVVGSSAQTHEVVIRVKEIIELKRQEQASLEANERARLAERVQSRERELDDLVFEIYGFDLKSDAEWIKVVREGNRHDVVQSGSSA